MADGLRFRRPGDRRRARRLCRGDPRRAARAEDRLRREPRDAGRHLPQRRLHPVQGAAPRLRAVRGSRARRRSPSSGVKIERRRARPRRDARREGQGGQGADRRHRVPVQEEQGRLAQGRSRRSRAPTPGQGRRPHGHARRTSSSPPARRSLRCPASRSTTRRRIVDSTGALELAAGAQAPGGDRRRGDRARAGLGLAAARRQGHRGRVPRPDPARHGRRGAQGSRQDLQEAGLRLPHCRPRSPSAEGQGRQGHADGRAGQGRRGRDASRPTRCWSRSAAGPTPTGSASTRSGSRPTSAARSRPTTSSAPRSPASGRSATSSPGRCSRTRPRTRASRSPRTSPA